MDMASDSESMVDSSDKLSNTDFTAVEDDLGFLLNGGVPARTAHCPVDISPRNADAFIPVTKRTVCYIVASVVINDAGEVLFIQEAKRECYGHWYLPAGRMEPNETIVEGAKREVFEETGLEFEPDTMLSVEIGCGSWYRFTFLGHATGGKLKTLAEGDKESLQARWMTPEDLKDTNNYPLRAQDILKLVAVGLNYRSKKSETQHPSILPVINGHQKIIIRVVVAHKAGDDVFVLTNTRDIPHFPSLHPLPIVYARMEDNLGMLFKDALGTSGDAPNLDVLGVLSLEHHGKPEAVNDGFAITLLLSFNDEIMPKIRKAVEATYTWHKLMDSELKQKLVKRLSPGMCVTLFA